MAVNGPWDYNLYQSQKNLCPALETQHEIKSAEPKLITPQVIEEGRDSATNDRGETSIGMEDDEEPKPKLPPITNFDADEDDFIKESNSEEEEPITIGQLFQNAVKKFPKHPALKYKIGKKWKSITFTGYYELCIRAAKSFLKVRVHGTACMCVPQLVFGENSTS